MKIFMNVMIVAVGAVTVFFGGNAEAETVRLAQFEIPPFVSEHFPDGGVMCRIVREVFALHGIEITLRWYPPKRATAMVQTGAADFSLGYLKTPERERIFLFNDEPLVDESVVFFSRKDTVFEWETIDDLKGLRVGDKLGRRSTGEAYLAAEKTGKLAVERVATDEQNIKKLLAGRIDVLVGSFQEITAILRTKFSPEEQVQIVVHPKPLLEGRFYAIFNKQLSPQIVRAFNDGIQELRENGQFDRLFSEILQQ